VLLLAGLGALSTDDPEPAALPRSGPLAGILDPRVHAPPVTDGLAYNSTKQWDSVGHMSLVAALETEFNVMLDTDEIISMSSVAVVRQVLTKHGVSFA